MIDLTNKVALVTGGASGIGGAISQLLAEHGATVIAHYFKSADAVDELNTKLKQQGSAGHIIGIQADLSNPANIASFVEQVSVHAEHIDILINNAGDLVERHSLDTIQTSFWDKVMAVNVTSMMMVTQGVLPLLKRAPDGASVVNMASLAGRKGGHAGSLAYSTAKGAVLTFTRSLAAEVAADQIRVNAVAPGLILGSSFHATHTTDESARQTIAGIPLQRAGNLMDVARPVVFLASEYSGFITGATLDINGGVYMA